MFRLSTLNERIKKEVHPEWEVAKGSGYFYFIGPHTEHLVCASVYVTRLNDFSIDRWMLIAKDLFVKATVCIT